MRNLDGSASVEAWNHPSDDFERRGDLGPVLGPIG